MIPVRCQVCSRRFGQGTSFGEMVLMPDSEGGRWAWSSHGRRRIYGGAQRITSRVGDLVESGGVALKCRRCGHAPRFRVARLAAQADSLVGVSGGAILL